MQYGSLCTNILCLIICIHILGEKNTKFETCFTGGTYSNPLIVVSTLSLVGEMGHTNPKNINFA